MMHVLTIEQSKIKSLLLLGFNAFNKYNYSQNRKIKFLDDCDLMLAQYVYISVVRM